MPTGTAREMTSGAQPRNLIGTPPERALARERTRLHARDRERLARSPHTQMVKSAQPCAESLAELEQRYGAGHAERLYG